MALPTFKEVSGEVSNVWRRFYLSALAALVAMVSAIIANHAAFDSGGFGVMEQYSAIALTCLFAFPLFLAIALFAEGHGLKKPIKVVMDVLAIVVAILLYFYFFRGYENWADNDMIRFFGLNLSAWLAVLFGPYIFRFKSKPNGFWRHTMMIAERLLLAFVMFGALFAGVAALLASIDYLFEVTIDGEYYADAWFIITGILVSHFFLSGVAKDFLKLEKDNSYAKVVKFFSQYILVPLVMVYFVVLYIYTGKIVLTWEWPLGGVAWWIIAFSMVGVVTYFLTAAQKEKFHRYVELFRKWFFVILIPMVGVLFVAIWWRISAYGVTEPRYIVVMFGIWLLLMSLYFLFSVKKNLKVLAWTMFVAILLTLYGGPVGAFEMSKNSQLGQLEALLEENGILVEGKVVKIAALPAGEDKDVPEIANKILYLIQHHGTVVIQPWFNEDLSGLGGSSAMGFDAWIARDEIIKLMGLPGDFVLGRGEYLTYVAKSECEIGFCPVEVKGYDYFLQNIGFARHYTDREGSVTELIDGYYIRFDAEDGGVYLGRRGWFETEIVDADELVVKLRDTQMARSLGHEWSPNSYEFDKDLMTLPFENNFVRGVAMVGMINFSQTSANEVDVDTIDMSILWGEK